MAKSRVERSAQRIAKGLRGEGRGHQVLSSAAKRMKGHAADPVSGPSVLETFPHHGSASDPVVSVPAVATSVPATHQGVVSPKADVAAVILAGGVGERLGVEGGKQLLELMGKPVLTWSIESFDAVPEVGLIVVVCPKHRIEEYIERAVEPFDFVTPVSVVPAGTIRQESSFNGVEAVPEDFDLIAIHDGARPLVTPEHIAHVISAVKGNIDADGAVMGHPSVDTLKVVSGNQIVGTPDRSSFWNAQTPQVFRSDVIRTAHMSAMADGFVGTDDSSLVERIGGVVVLVLGSRDNLKVTVPEDVVPIEAVLRSRIAVGGMGEDGADSIDEDSGGDAGGVEE